MDEEVADVLVPEVQPEPVPLSDADFKDQLGAVIPHLRAFGRSLSGSRDLADDLVQETLLKAWAARKRFQARMFVPAWKRLRAAHAFRSVSWTRSSATSRLPESERPNARKWGITAAS